MASGTLYKGDITGPVPLHIKLASDTCPNGQIVFSFSDTIGWCLHAGEAHKEYQYSLFLCDKNGGNAEFLGTLKIVYGYLNTTQYSFSATDSSKLKGKDLYIKCLYTYGQPVPEISNNCTVTVNTYRIPYYINAQVMGEMGSITASSTTAYYQNLVTFTKQSDFPNKFIEYITEPKNLTISSDQFIMPNQNVKITAMYSSLYAGKDIIITNYPKQIQVGQSINITIDIVFPLNKTRQISISLGRTINRTLYEYNINQFTISANATSATLNMTPINLSSFGNIVSSNETSSNGFCLLLRELDNNTTTLRYCTYSDITLYALDSDLIPPNISITVSPNYNEITNYILGQYVQNHCKFGINISLGFSNGAIPSEFNLRIYDNNNKLFFESHNHSAGSLVTPLITGYGVYQIVAEIWDSRGKNAFTSTEVQVLPYIPPSGSISAWRILDSNYHIPNPGGNYIEGNIHTYITPIPGNSLTSTITVGNNVITTTGITNAENISSFIRNYSGTAVTAELTDKFESVTISGVFLSEVKTYP